jgi:outer membrane protein assembly factor BamB
LGEHLSWSGIAYDNGRIFAVNYDGILRAFDGQTGQQAWAEQLTLQYSYTSAPTARNGMVYVLGAGINGTLYAVREADGSIAWTGSLLSGDDSSPAVSAEGVYVSQACEHTYEFALLSGHLLWQHTTGCEGGGGHAPVLHNNRLYVRDWVYTPVILDAQSGNVLGTFSAGPAPAFDGNLGFFLSGSTLSAIDQTNNQTVWSFTGDGNLASAPIVVNGKVYIGSGASHLYALDAATGRAVFSTNLPAPVNSPGEDVAETLVGLGAGNGELLVPASNWLIAFTSPQLPPCDGERFKDVCPTDYFYTATLALATDNILSGYSTVPPCNNALWIPCFKPYNTSTRGQISKVVSLAAGFNEPVSGQTFEDVPPGSAFYTYTERMAERNIISGYPCGGSGEPCVPPDNRPYFRTNNNVTRGQLSKMVSLAFGWNDPPVGQDFEDVPPGSTFYTYVAQLHSRSIIQGYPCGGSGEPCVPPANLPYFRPNNNVTRGQTAKIVQLSRTQPTSTPTATTTSTATAATIVTASATVTITATSTSTMVTTSTASSTASSTATTTSTP